MKATGARIVIAAMFAVSSMLLGFTGGGSSPGAAAGPLTTPRFECGPQALSYDVVTVSGEQADGIRCLVNLGAYWGSRKLVWYGEGRWGAMTYRHLGAAYLYPDPLPNQYAAYAADFHGNGESFNGSTRDLTLRAAEGAWPNPTKIEVRGAWNEDWLLQSDIFVAGPLYEALPRPTTCGPNFDEYTATSPAGIPGSGLRCLMKTDMAPATTWFGNGQWGNQTYTHLGVRSAQNHKAQAWDLCNGTYGDFCGATALGGLTIIPTPGGYDVIAGWNEEWRK